jgi:hypothetical protein
VTNNGADASSPAGLLNEGYWGIAVRPNTSYTGSFYNKSSAGVSVNTLPRATSFLDLAEFAKLSGAVGEGIGWNSHLLGHRQV